MINRFKRYHIIHNFPKGYPVLKRVVANLIFFFTAIIIHPRKNLLTHKDLILAKDKLRRGDIVLEGLYRTVLGKLIHEPITHSSIFLGKRRFVHAFSDGVQYISLHKVFTDYDSLCILRLPKFKGRRKVIEKALEYAEKQVGKPYNYYFRKKIDSFFCTQLVNESFRHAGYNTGLASFKKPRKRLKKIEEKIFGGVEALHPLEILKGNFEIIWLSHDLKFFGKKLMRTE